MVWNSARDSAVQQESSSANRGSRRNWNWKGLRYKIFPVEVLFLLFYFLVLYHPKIYTQLFFQRLAQDALALVANDSTTVSFCLNQTYIVNHTSNATFEKVQTAANHLNMYSEVISLGTGSLMALLYGPLSDIIGRKPIFIVLFTGILLAGLMQLVVIVFKLNLYFNLICMAIYGLGGGYATMTGVAFAAASDVTPKIWLAARMGILESCISFGTVMSFLIGYNWLQSDNCDFVPPVLLIIGTSVFCLAYLVFFPEPMNKVEVRNNYGTDENRGFIKLLNGAKILFKPNFIGFSNWWRVWLLCIVISLESLCEIGSDEIINYFLYNKPLEWSYHFISYYGAYFNVLNALSLLVLCPILIGLKFRKHFIILIPIVAAVICNVLTGFVKRTWEMFVVGGFLSVRDLGFPVLRSMLALYVSPKLYGSILTLASAMEAISSSGASILFNEVYHPEAVVNGRNINAGVIFWISAGIWALNIPLVVILLYFDVLKAKVHKANPVRLVDEERLLDSNSNNYGATINQ